VVVPVEGTKETLAALGGNKVFNVQKGLTSIERMSEEDGVKPSRFTVIEDGVLETTEK